jgi:excisionase family DNA binding protein
VNDERLYSPKEVAQMWGISRETVLRLIRCEELQAIRIGNVLRVADSELEAYKKRGATSGRFDARKTATLEGRNTS